MSNASPPIFILGVPRSGTTLLRTILNCHPAIACGPEAPWLAHQAQNIMALHETLTTGEHSYCKNFGVPPEMVKGRIRQLINGLFHDFAEQQGKIRWAHKTPDDSMHAGFFTSLFPEAKFIHLIRHPLDAALSNTKVAAHRTGVSEWHEQNILIEAGVPVKNNLFNSVLRWRRWNERIRQSLAGVSHFQVRYEDLVGRPVETFGALFAFLGEPFSPEILDYKKFPGIFPEWEWGSADVQRAKSINTASVDRWKKELTSEEASVLSSLSGASSTAALSEESEPAAASLARRREIFLAGMNDLAASFALDSLAQEPETAAWWFAGLDHLEWRNLRVIDLRAGLSPWPWFVALLGARITLIDSRPEFLPVWEELRRKLRLEIDWKIIAGGEPLPSLGSESVDLVISHRILGASGEVGTDPKEIIRWLKPGGRFARSDDGGRQAEIARLQNVLGLSVASASSVPSWAAFPSGAPEDTRVFTKPPSS